MRPGHRVTIYEDPLTQQRPEGTATVRRVHSATPEGGGTLYRADVQFDGDEPEDTYPRNFWMAVADAADR